MNKSLLIVFVFLSTFSFSQKEPALMDETIRSVGNNDFIISTAAHYGVILMPPRIQNVIKNNASGAEFNFIIPTHGKKSWERNYHYPEMGLTFIALDFGNPAELGQGYCLFPFINFNLTHGKYFSLKFKLTNSLGYISKHYDAIDNPRNVAIGSHFNGFVTLRFNAQIRLSEQIRIEMGFGLQHFSNGAMLLPNYGMNVVSGSIGVGYHFNTKNIKLIPDTFTKPDQHLHMVIYSSGGMSAIKRSSLTRYGAAILSFNVQRFYGSRTMWNAGLEFVYNAARLKETQLDPNIHNYSDPQNLQVGVKVGYAFVAGRVMLPVEMGMFLYSNPLDGYFFHRIGVRVRVTDHLIIGSTIKTQWARADFFEWGLGYTFPLRKNK